MTTKTITEMISNLCGIEASPKDIESINKVIDFLENLREEEKINE